MFGNTSNQNNANDKIGAKFIIVYDKFTKPMAVSLRNSITNETCVLWKKKDYEANEAKLTNKNNLIILDEDLIKSNFANPSLKPIHFSEGVLIKHEGNSMGIYIDPDADLKSFKDAFKESWKKYILSIVLPILTIGGIPGAVASSWLLLYGDKKKVKFRLLFDAINKLGNSGTIEKFLNGERLD